MDAPPATSTHPWRWVPSLYFCQAVPYVVVVTLSVTMYKRLGISNADLAFYTSWLYLPWVIKPLWAPFVERFRTKRWWIVTLQFFIGAGLAALAFAVPGPDFFRWTLAVFWLLAFSGATHDIASDGFYLLSLPPHQQAAFVGVRSTFFRLANISGQGGLVWLAGQLETSTGNIPLAWALVLALPAALFILFALYHQVRLPRPAGDGPARAANATGAATDWLVAFATFFRKPGIIAALVFILLYRLGEAQLVRLVSPFLLDARAVGGLGLGTKEVGIIYGMAGLIALTLGGLLGGWVVSRYGLKKMLWPMLVAIHAPNLAYVWLAYAQPSDLWLIGAAVSVEQFGYGFGFTAFVVYMMMIADGPLRTAHYALCTGFMALGMMVPGMFSGDIQTWLGYPGFFIWVCLATLPSIAATAWISSQIDPAFGKKAPA